MALFLLGSVLRDHLKGTLLNPTSGSLKRDLVERVYIPTPNFNFGGGSGVRLFEFGIWAG